MRRQHSREHLTSNQVSGKITPMNETRTIKIRLATYRLLKTLAAQSGETLLALLERLAQQEKDRQNADKSR